MPYVSVSGLPGSGLGNGCDHLHHSVAAHPALHNVLLSGQQLVQPPLPQRHSKLQLGDLGNNDYAQRPAHLLPSYYI